MITLEGYCPFVAADIEETMNNTLVSIIRHRINKFVSVGNSNIFEILGNGGDFDDIF
ncbi:hypothetical protein [Photorhabdus noenieputensis]|uniref:hypothetical protein n=1 Tax=Photorhabdus noenieputensis TaxID=1208607 RepID=UPI001BD368AF|nr:hypothetical protein [Photorhabdus noenieputensis]MCK3668339.1 hypothetical protein [Photorhabdus noenieputensis]